MNNRNLIVLAIVALVMIIVTAALYSGKGTAEGNFKGGALLIQGLDPAKIGSIAIKHGADAVTLVREMDGFLLAEKNNYPASVKQINDLLVRCLEIRCAEKITDSPKNHAELGVTEEDGTSVSFLDADGKPLVGLVTGETTERGSGAYVRLSDSDTVYATDTWLQLSTAATDYLDKQLISLKKDDVRQVEVEAGDDAYTIARDEEEKIVLQDIPEGKRVTGTSHEDVFGALSSLTLSDVAPAGNLDLSWDATYTCRLKNGLTYTVQTAKQDDKFYARLSAQGPEVQSVTITKTESEESLKQKEAILLAAEAAKTFTPQHADWVYEIPSWTAEKLRKPLADLIEDIPTEEAPEEIAASHILISFKGAERSEAERAKDEARTLADEVLGMAREENADFAELAKEYSDGPTKEKGGDLGTFGKDVMDTAFEEAAFKLKVGEISEEVVETPFGFHIIKRTK